MMVDELAKARFKKVQKELPATNPLIETIKGASDLRCGGRPVEYVSGQALTLTKALFVFKRLDTAPGPDEWICAEWDEDKVIVSSGGELHD